MLEQNRVWLEQANQGLLGAYKEQPKREADDYGDLRVLQMSHETANPTLPPSYISPIYYQKQKEIVQELPHLELQRKVNFCVLGGTDGGHILNHVISRHEIRHLVVIESDMQSFHHSLTVCDWPALFQDFEKRGGTIYFHIGKVTLEIRQQISKHIMEIGPQNCANIHMLTDATEGGRYNIQQVTHCLQDCINSLGFYDDERVGFAHTFHHMSKGSKFFATPLRKWIDKPIVVCGNGPSLKKSIKQIKENRKNIYLMSCASTIEALQHYGIKPDFHVAQERPECHTERLRRTTTPEFRKGIRCIALNTVHPMIHDLFDDVSFLLKSNDFGGIFARQFMFDCVQALFVNPQAANMGASVATYLGFKHIYLAGVDCAFGPDGSSHAVGQDHRDGDKIEVKGNFRDKVLSKRLFLDSRNTMELLIQNSEAIYYNLSDGVHISGSRPTKKIKPRHSRPLTIPQIMSRFRDYHGAPDRDSTQRQFVAGISRLKSVAQSIPSKIKGRDEALFYIESMYNELMKQKRDMLWYMVKGSITTQLVFLAGCAESNLEAFDKSSLIFKEFMDLISEDIKENLFKFDDWADNGAMPEDINVQS
jgi:hypothetical protein